MLTDLTLGQYYKANSIIHKLDARVKIILAFWYVALTFTIKSTLGYLLLILFTFVIILLSKVPFKMILKSLKPVVFFVILTGLLNLFLTDSDNILFEFGVLKITYDGVKYSVSMMLRIVFLIMGTSLLTYTTTPMALTNGIEKVIHPLSYIKVPTHDIAMMMTIALRFIPTLMRETDIIIKAQSSRGVDFNSGGIIKRTKAFIPILIPMFINSFKRADELAVAMECRCYKGGNNRTSLHILKVTKKDIIAIIIMLLFTALIIIFNIFNIL